MNKIKIYTNSTDVTPLATYDVTSVSYDSSNEKLQNVTTILPTGKIYNPNHLYATKSNFPSEGILNDTYKAVDTGNIYKYSSVESGADPYVLFSYPTIESIKTNLSNQTKIDYGYEKNSIWTTYQLYLNFPNISTVRTKEKQLIDNMVVDVVIFTLSRNTTITVGTDYSGLQNKPSINGHTVSGLLTGDSLDLQNKITENNKLPYSYISGAPVIPTNYATLDTNGKVPSSQLPSYVDDVLEYSSQTSFPTAGESGKIYIAQDSNKLYRWNGSSYVVVSETLAIGTTAATAAAGNHTHTNATTSAAGFISSTDKTKLDGIATGANNYTHPTYNSKTNGLYKVTVDGTGHVSDTTVVTKADITGLGIPASDTNTTYSAGTGIVLNGTTFSNSGVRSISQDETDGHKLIINTNGTSTTLTIPDNNTVTTINTTGSGNAVTSISASNGILTVAKDSTFLTNHQDISNKANTSEAGYSLSVSGTTVSLKNKVGIVLSSITTQDTNTTYSAATTSIAGLMSAEDKTKLNGIATGANNYSLPNATTSTLGGVKIGSGLSVNSGTVSLGTHTTSLISDFTTAVQTIITSNVYTGD